MWIPSHNEGPTVAGITGIVEKLEEPDPMYDMLHMSATSINQFRNSLVKSEVKRQSRRTPASVRLRSIDNGARAGTKFIGSI